MDEIDLQLLAIIQENASLTVAQISKQVGLSTTPCWRRLQRLDHDGFIDGRVTLLNSARIGLELTVFVMVKTNQHNSDWLQRFDEAVRKHTEIVEVNRLAGEYDYLLKVVTKNNASYDRFYRNLIDSIDLSDVTSCLSMEQIKHSTKLPLDVL